MAFCLVSFTLVKKAHAHLNHFNIPLLSFDVPLDCHLYLLLPFFPCSSAHSGFACGSETLTDTLLTLFPLFLLNKTNNYIISISQALSSVHLRVAWPCYLEKIKLGVSKFSMIKRSPSRNHRSRGIKVKHVLQIILLLGVCFWLIYQVKHSHDKKKEFDENDAKVSVRTQTPKLGRKDLHPGKDDVNQNEKHEEEEEDENIVEDEDKHEHNEHEEEGSLHESEDKEENKHGMREEEDEDENKSDEMDDERGGGDDEIDENDQEQSVVDTDHDEELDEEKEKEEEHDEKEDENSEDDEKDGSVKKHNSHEAREEHYKGDDASSAVTHDTHTTSSETETVNLENSDVKSEMNIMKSENKPNHTEESDRNQHNSNFNITKVELTGGTSSNATSGKETGSNILSNAMNSSHLDNFTTTYSDGHSEASNNPTVVIPGGSNNMTGTSADTSSGQNKIAIYSESNQAQNGMVNITVTGGVKNGQTEGLEQGSNRVSEENLPGPNSTVSVKTETGDAAAGESSNLEGGESTRLVASKETETSETNKTQNISLIKENTDATKDEEFKGDTQTDETSHSSSVKGTSDSVEHHDTDSSDSNILKEVAEVRTDLSTLPDIKEGDNGDATATD
ncbi:hypothetical protein VNO77_41731 [Canavalia gladiata]|uniref:Uncharacterized protein n=1 Tax=Canavalia gladiata TaxID=3824 RepID=A0AAN9PS25_CANGL